MVDELRRQTRELDDHVQQLTAEVSRLNDRADRADRDKRWLVLGLLLVVGLVALVAYVAVRAEATSQSEHETREKVLCPLYGLILGGYDPGTRAAGPDRDKYESTFQVIRSGWDTMQCTTPLVPPRTER